MRIAVYPGSFDPPTHGHMDLIRRAARLFDRLIIAVGRNPGKDTLFEAGDRVEMLREITEDLANVEVEVFDGLLMDFAKGKGASAVVRGLRAVSDFDSEFQMALMNRTLAPEIETVFLMASAEHMFVSSSIVKEVAELGGDIRELVPEPVARRLAARPPTEV
ncbi:MAG: pantetheine-phosphate adenylyltransferase [Armatimonadetes bacterium]|nr:pantetheine-phosphate adenylyltransferase [Armatimonadota bacterium]